jgi:acyl-CoA thioesterase-1
MTKLFALFSLLLACCFTSACAKPGEARILILGDSLTVGPGVNKAYPDILTDIIPSLSVDVSARNGYTLSQGKSLWEARSSESYDWVLIVLGANDYLKRIPKSKSRAYLLELVQAVKASGSQPILVGVALPNHSSSIYAEVGRETNTPVIPNLLAGVAGNPRLNFSDGLHPNQSGHRKMAEGLTSPLTRIIRQP